MQTENRLPIALLTLRLSIFLVMLVWTLDKFTNPAHASSVYESFYFIGGLGPTAIYVLGAIELLIIVGFVLGVAKTFTYGAVFLFHAVSTITPFAMYLDLSEGLLFFAAWPMLAACFTLFLLRDHDTRWTVYR